MELIMNITTTVYGILAALMLLFFVNLGIESVDCNRRGGEMMKSWYGGYVCVKPLKEGK